MIKQNNFSGNRLAVKLGEHQSADMESQGKSRQQVQAFLVESGRKGKMAVFSPVSGIVDLRDNWWGASPIDTDTDALFYAQKQSRWVLDDSSGERYLRDRIEFIPWLKAPVANAGLE
jgi:hypothetical protein